MESLSNRFDRRSDVPETNYEHICWELLMTVRKELTLLMLGQTPYPTPVTATQGNTIVIPILQIRKPRPKPLVRLRKPEASKIHFEPSGQTFSIFLSAISCSVRDENCSTRQLTTQTCRGPEFNRKLFSP